MSLAVQYIDYPYICSVQYCIEAHGLYFALPTPVVNWQEYQEDQVGE